MLKETKRGGMLLLPLLTLIMLLLPSCKEGPLYGKLEGLWQIMEYYDAQGASVELPGRRYMAFQRNVVQLHNETGVVDRLTGNLYYNEPALHLDFPDAFGDETLERKLYEWGFYANPIELKVVSVSSKQLILAGEGETRWVCRRF